MTNDLETPSTFERVQAFAAAFTGIRPERINLGTTLETDLRLTGDDGEDFMWDFFREFDLDYARFDGTRYFAPEGFDPTGLTLYLRKLIPGLPPLTNPTQDITMADLVKAVDEGGWTIVGSV